MLLFLFIIEMLECSHYYSPHLIIPKLFSFIQILNKSFGTGPDSTRA